MADIVDGWPRALSIFALCTPATIPPSRLTARWTFYNSPAYSRIKE